MANFQNNAVQNAAYHAAFVPPARASVNSIDFKDFFLQKINKLKEISIAMTDPDTPLNMPEIGMNNITGDDKNSQGTLFALKIYMSSYVENPFDLVLSNYMKIGEMLYDKASQLLTSGR